MKQSRIKSGQRIAYCRSGLKRRKKPVKVNLQRLMQNAAKRKS